MRSRATCRGSTLTGYGSSGRYHSHPAVRRIPAQGRGEPGQLPASVRGGVDSRRTRCAATGAVRGRYRGAVQRRERGRDERRSVVPRRRRLGVVTHPFELECVGAGCSTPSRTAPSGYAQLADHFAGKKNQRRGKAETVSRRSLRRGRRKRDVGDARRGGGRERGSRDLSRVWRDGLSRGDKRVETPTIAVARRYTRAARARARPPAGRSVPRRRRQRRRGVGGDETVEAAADAANAGGEAAWRTRTRTRTRADGGPSDGVDNFRLPPPRRGRRGGGGGAVVGEGPFVASLRERSPSPRPCSSRRPCTNTDPRLGIPHRRVSVPLRPCR